MDHLVDLNFICPLLKVIHMHDLQLDDIKSFCCLIG